MTPQITKTVVNDNGVFFTLQLPLKTPVKVARLNPDGRIHTVGNLNAYKGIQSFLEYLRGKA